VTIKVDLLDRPGRRMGFDPIIIFLVLIIIVFVVFFIVWGKRYDDMIQAKRQEITDIDQKIRELESKIPDIKRYEKENDDLAAQIKAIKQLVYDPIRYRNLLDEIALIMPKNIFISNLNIEPNNKSMTFSGTAVEIGTVAPLTSISNFMQKIQNSPYFDDATLTSTSRGTFEGKPSFGFQIRAHYNPEVAARSAPSP